jgi:hypothetical protein
MKDAAVEPRLPEMWCASMHGSSAVAVRIGIKTIGQARGEFLRQDRSSAQLRQE